MYCLQEGRIRHTSVNSVCAEKYFYRLQELTPEDVDFLREGLIRGAPHRLKAFHESLVQHFTLPHLMKRRLEAADHPRPEAITEIDRIITELNENLHTSIEHRFRPYLAAMISGSLAFLQDPKQAAVFYSGLAAQYARTHHVSKSQRVMTPERMAMYRRIANPLTHIMAANVGLSLYAERERHTIILLDNPTRVPFVTADQPIINMAAKPRGTEPPEKFELYYPLSPRKAMLLLEPLGDFFLSDTAVSEGSARFYNLQMAAHSYRQVVSDSVLPLELVRDELSASMGGFPQNDI